MTNIAYIGIGSNIDDKFGNCNAALVKLNKLESTKVAATSEWYQSKALTVNPSEVQPDYINGVTKIKTELSPEKLLSEFKEIEKSFGRNPDDRKWAPRVIDLDILFFNDSVIDTEMLKIPHPELHKRTFVLRPLCDIEPNLIHPVLGKETSKLLQELENAPVL